MFIRQNRGTLSKNRRDVEFRAPSTTRLSSPKASSGTPSRTSTTTGVSWISKRDETNTRVRTGGPETRGTPQTGRCTMRVPTAWEFIRKTPNSLREMTLAWDRGRLSRRRSRVRVSSAPPFHFVTSQRPDLWRSGRFSFTRKGSRNETRSPDVSRSGTRGTDQLHTRSAW